MTPWAHATNRNDALCGVTCLPDYVSFMPVVSKQCNTLLAYTDKKMITNDFATRAYVSSPVVPSSCHDLFTMNVYNKDDDVTGNKVVIAAVGFSTKQ
uniref:GMC_oxred_C domain-containing protein n=1 Tax=Rhabditophanes sp. KR3021 TaxID=114890 RepID=A0AC35TVM6_9BILA